MTPDPRTLSRRRLFAGAGTAGALAAVATVVPMAPSPEPPVAEAKPAPARGGGYAATAHVQHYYKTARV